MKYLSRNKVYEKVKPTKDAKKVYIVCEGQDKEYKYFQYFEGFSSNIDIIPLPSVNGMSDPLKLKEQAQLLFFGNEEEEISPKYILSQEYKDEVWFVIDTDRWNEGDKINQLKAFCAKQNRWYVAQSNPCFEIWQYYHIHKQKPHLEEISKCATFKEFVHNSILGGFDNRRMPIEIDTAISNSVSNFELGENKQPALYSTDLYRIGNVIISFIQNELIKAKEKMIDSNVNRS